MIEIDLNDTVSVELTEWGAEYLNATNIFKEITTTQKCHYKTDYKAGDVKGHADITCHGCKIRT